MCLQLSCSQTELCLCYHYISPKIRTLIIYFWGLASNRKACAKVQDIYGYGYENRKVASLRIIYSEIVSSGESVMLKSVQESSGEDAAGWALHGNP